MTFTEIVDTIAARLNLTSPTAITRIGVTVNDYYAQIVTAIGLNTSVRTTAYGVVSPGSQFVDFTGIQKVTGVYMPGDTQDRVLSEVLNPDMRESTHPTSDLPSKYAVYRVGARTASIWIDVVPTTAFTLIADGVIEQSTLSDDDEPAFPASFHDVLIHGVMMDELRKMEKTSLAVDRQNLYEQRLADLKYFLAKSAYLTIKAGLPRTTGPVTGGASAVPTATGPSAWWINVLDYGAIGNGITNDTTAINNALSALPSTGGGVLIFPAGKVFRMTSPLTISKPCMIWGVGGGSWTTRTQGSTIYFDGCDGIKNVANNAERSRIQNIRIYGTDTAGKVGLSWKSHALHLDNVQVQHFPLTGVDLDSTGGGSPLPNLNNSYLEKLAISFCGTGLRIVGDNANVITVVSSEVQQCTGWGYYITGGNVKLDNPLGEDNTLGDYYIGGTSNMVLNPYAENANTLFFPGSNGTDSSNNWVICGLFAPTITGDLSSNFVMDKGGWNILRIGGTTGTADADLKFKITSLGMVFDGQSRMNSFRVAHKTWAISATLAHGDSLTTTVTVTDVRGQGLWDAAASITGAGIDWSDGWQISAQADMDLIKVCLTNVSGSSKSPSGDAILRVKATEFNS